MLPKLTAGEGMHYYSQLIFDEANNRLQNMHQPPIVTSVSLIFNMSPHSGSKGLQRD